MTHIARTGRVQNWIDDPTSRLPVSCTVFQVEDSVEGDDGIEASWRFVSHALRNAAGVAVHLTQLRPNGHENSKGLVASGPVSFGKIYSTLNEVLRRGGAYKNGACVLHLDISHTDILEFVTASRQDLPWVKRCVNLDEPTWLNTPREVKDAILQGIKTGDIWLAKFKYQNGKRILPNVCLEVFLPSRGTCLLQHVNLGSCNIDDLVPAFTQGMSELCALHSRTGVGDTGEYLPPEIDRQVGLGMLGLANLLRRSGVTYEEFGHALDRIDQTDIEYTAADSLARELRRAIRVAATIARQHNMERAFAIAPTASCSYRHNDADGYTTTPEIAPPVARQIDRDSGTFGVETYDYGDVEIAVEVGWENYKRVADGICRLLHDTGLFHGYSFNSWSDMVTYDDDFIHEWLQSPQTSLYYALQVQPDTQRKDDALAVLDEDFRDLFGFEEETDNFCVSCAE
jgi:hypothetical protein